MVGDSLRTTLNHASRAPNLCLQSTNVHAVNQFDPKSITETCHDIVFLLPRLGDTQRHSTSS